MKFIDSCNLSLKFDICLSKNRAKVSHDTRNLATLTGSSEKRMTSSTMTTFAGNAIKLSSEFKTLKESDFGKKNKVRVFRELKIDF